jgi:hypothetical protein
LEDYFLLPRVPSIQAAAAKNIAANPQIIVNPVIIFFLSHFNLPFGILLSLSRLPFVVLYNPFFYLSENLYY